MNVVQLVFVAITPGIALCLALYLVDKYEREPFSYLFYVFVMGCLSTFPTVYFENLLQRFNPFSGTIRILVSSFLVIALVEEVCKRGAVLVTVFKKKVFSEKLDGIIYASFAALGFATVENIIYVVIRFPHIKELGYFRAFLSVPAHMLYAISMGYYLSLWKYETDPKKKRVYRIKSLLVPVLLHGSFDVILMLKTSKVTMLFIPFLVYMWYTNIKKLLLFYQDSKMAQRED